MTELPAHRSFYAVELRHQGLETGSKTHFWHSEDWRKNNEIYEAHEKTQQNQVFRRFSREIYTAAVWRQVIFKRSNGERLSFHVLMQHMEDAISLKVRWHNPSIITSWWAAVWIKKEKKKEKVMFDRAWPNK